MENASKALIIAGAILLAIVIISLGLIVVNNVRGSVDDSNLSEQEIQSFNAKFTAYQGKNVSGSRVNSLIQQVIASNQSCYNNGDSDGIVAILFPVNDTDYYGISYYNGAVSHVENKRTKDNVSETGKGAIRAVGNSGYSFSVKTGVNYNVDIQYAKGRVSKIIVKYMSDV